jgi:hypothetical protein
VSILGGPVRFIVNGVDLGDHVASVRLDDIEMEVTAFDSSGWPTPWDWDDDDDEEIRPTY